MEEQQLTIDWTRAEQLALLRDAVLPTFRSPAGDAVSPLLAGAVLRAIDEHGRGRHCWASLETLAAVAQCSRRSVVRALQALTTAGVLCVETTRRGRSFTNTYVIVWSELAIYRRAPEAQIHSAMEPVHSATVSIHSATTPVHSAMVSIHSAMVSPKPPLSAPESPPNRPPSPQRRPAAAEYASDRGGGGTSSLPFEWQAVVAEWRSRLAQIRPLAEQAWRDHEPLESFANRVAQAWRTATHQANKGRFANPAGAVIYQIRQGSWPAEGVVEGDEADRRAARSAERAVATAAESAAYDRLARLRQVWRQGEAAGLTEPEIYQRLVREGLPAEWLAEQGWTAAGREQLPSVVAEFRRLVRERSGKVCVDDGQLTLVRVQRER